MCNKKSSIIVIFLKKKKTIRRTTAFPWNSEETTGGVLCYLRHLPFMYPKNR